MLFVVTWCLKTLSVFVVGLYNKATPNSTPPPFYPKKEGNYGPNVSDEGGERGLRRGQRESNLSGGSGNIPGCC